MQGQLFTSNFLREGIRETLGWSAAETEFTAFRENVLKVTQSATLLFARADGCEPVAHFNREAASSQLGKIEGRELTPSEKKENVVLRFRPLPTRRARRLCGHAGGRHGARALSFAAGLISTSKKSRMCWHIKRVFGLQ